MILIREIKTKGKTLVTVCDQNALGKKYKDDVYCLDLIRYRKFYEGKPLNQLKKEEVEQMLNNASSISVIGDESIEFIKNHGFDVSNKKIIGSEEKVTHINIYRI